jgi:8-oxo-dGTP diphosphatase
MTDQKSSPEGGTRVGIAVVEWHGRFLVGVRGESGPLAGLDEFPGGKCQPGETQAAAAVRECREETGLDVFAVDLLMQRTFDYPHGVVDLQFWLCRPQPRVQDQVPGDCQGYRWVERTELKSLRFPAANAALIEQLLQRE